MPDEGPDAAVPLQATTTEDVVQCRAPEAVCAGSNGAAASTTATSHPSHKKRVRNLPFIMQILLRLAGDRIDLDQETVRTPS